MGLNEKLRAVGLTYDNLMKMDIEQLKAAVTYSLAPPKQSVKFVTITKEEGDALNNVQKAADATKDLINKILDKKGELEKNAKEAEKAINDKFISERSIKKIGKRYSLLGSRRGK